MAELSADSHPVSTEPDERRTLFDEPRNEPGHE
jgi:hypothetical protein